MRAAIIHYWLLNMRGGERVVESLCRLLPEADLFTLFYDPDRVSPLIRSRRVRASYLNPLRRHYRSLLPFMPVALEHFDLRGYDLVISSESGPAKGVITSSETRHICYCHSPMRYLWDLYPAYLHDWTRSRWKRALIAPLASRLRVWDYAAAARVDEFAANSENVKRRIWKAWRREAAVIYPPVAVEQFEWRPAKDYYLTASELVAYKRIEDAVVCCSRSGRKLKVVGDGPEYRRLRKVAGPGIEFLGHVSDAELRELYSGCRAFLMPAEEDFGITAVEALASGKAVVALGKGGVLESVPSEEPRAGFFYTAPGPDGLDGALARFEQEEESIDAQALQAWAGRFNEQRFHAQMSSLIRKRENPQ